MTPPFKLPIRLERAAPLYEDVDHIALMKERVIDWTQQELAERHADNPPYLHIIQMRR